ncbi:MAG: DUF4174 domain-containing protein [Bacteroidota bacterium]
MKYLLIWLLLFTTITITAQELSAYQWQNRLLLVVASNKESEELAAQLALLQEDKEGLKERKLIVFQIVQDSYAKGIEVPKKWHKSTLEYGSKENTDDKLLVHLIGLDGGLKRTWDSPVRPNVIYSLIDQMPMRRAEMRRRGKTRH